MQRARKTPSYLLRDSVLECAPEATPKGHTRICCLSDTHNQHHELNVPLGDVLVHCGDVLTESGLRHIEDGRPTKAGLKLVKTFAKWFGKQPHPLKVLVGGNHDSVLDKMGENAVYELFEKYCEKGTFAYLLGTTVSVEGSIKVFGSPYARYGGHNNAFFRDENFEIEKGTHVMVTHYPAILPTQDGGFRESREYVDAIHYSGALLHLGGHCHWAYGFYKTAEKGIPSVCVSNCDSKWLRNDLLQKPRGDAKGDLMNGGYNVANAVVVCDINVSPPPKGSKWVKHKK